MEVDLAVHLDLALVAEVVLEVVQAHLVAYLATLLLAQDLALQVEAVLEAEAVLHLDQMETTVLDLLILLANHTRKEDQRKYLCALMVSLIV